MFKNINLVAIYKKLNNIYRQKTIFLKSKTRRDIQWAFLSVLSPSIAYFILRVIIGNHLGSTELGIYTLAFTIYLFGLQFSAFGFGSALTKYVAENSLKINIIEKYCFTGILGSLISGIIISCMFYALSPIIANNIFSIPNLEPLLKITSISFPFIAIQQAILGILNGERNMRIYANIYIFQNTMLVFFTILFVFFLNLSLIGAILGYVIPSIITSVICLILYFRNSSCTKYQINYKYLKKMTNFGFFFLLATSTAFLNSQISVFIIGFFLKVAEVGIYTVAITFAQVLTIIPSAVQRVTSPAIAFSHGTKGKTSVRKLAVKAMVNSSIITLFLGIVLIITGPWLITSIFSKDYISAYEPLLVLIIGNICFAPIIAVGSIFPSIDKLDIPFKLNIICLMLTIVLNVLLIPSFGILGAAVTTTCIQISMLIVNMALIFKYTQ